MSLELGNSMIVGTSGGSLGSHYIGDYPWWPQPTYYPQPVYHYYPVYIGAPSTKDLEDKIAAFTEQVEKLTRALKAKKRA